MNWGGAFSSAWHAAGDATKEAVTATMNSAETAVVAVGNATVAAGQATVTAATAMGHAAVSTGRAVGRAAVATGKGIGNVAGFGVRATGEIITTAAQVGLSAVDSVLEQHPTAGPAYKLAKEFLSPTKPPRATVVQPCPNSEEEKIKRLEQRRKLIERGNGPGSNHEVKAAAERLARNNDAVELARLSEDAYKQYDLHTPKDHQPPLGWHKVEDSGIDGRLLKDSKAVIYRNPTNWPGGQKTVVAFRGTEASESEDIKTDIDQALGKQKLQYTAAAQLGSDIQETLGEDTIVTGHSLGGGKAQAAGATGHLKGMMFNSAGLHPDSVDGLMPEKDQFVQYRAPFDPLTGTQNSAALQTVAAVAAGATAPFAAGMTTGNFIQRQLGLPELTTDTADYAKTGSTAVFHGMGNLVSKGYVIPPAQGKVIEVPSIDKDGKPTKMRDLGGQHSVTNLINGIEKEKSEDVATLSNL